MVVAAVSSAALFAAGQRTWPLCESPLDRPEYDSAFAAAAFAQDARFEYPSTYVGDQEEWLVNLCNLTRKSPKAAERCGNGTAGFWIGEWTSGSENMTAACLSFYTELDLGASSPSQDFRAAGIAMANSTSIPQNLSALFHTTDRSASLRLTFVCDRAADRGLEYSPATLVVGSNGTTNSGLREMLVRTNTLCGANRSANATGGGGEGDTAKGGRDDTMVIVVVVCVVSVVVFGAATLLACCLWRRARETQHRAMMVAGALERGGK